MYDIGMETGVVVWNLKKLEDVVCLDIRLKIEGENIICSFYYNNMFFLTISINSFNNNNKEIVGQTCFIKFVGEQSCEEANFTF